MFAECISLQELDLSSFDFFEATDLSYMFIQCNNLEEIEITYGNTECRVNVLDMFYGCDKLNHRR